MQVVLAVDPPRDLVVEVRSPDATLADVLAAAGVPCDAVTDWDWWVDGTHTDPTTATVADVLTDGAVVSPHPVDPVVRHGVDRGRCVTQGAVDVAVVAGPGTGEVLHVRAGRNIEVGRHVDDGLRLSSSTVSARHLRLVAHHDDVELTDHGSRNGTWIDGVPLVPEVPTTMALPVTVRLGACVMRVAATRGCDAPVGRTARLPDGRHAFNRPPRPRVPPEVPAVDVPAVPEDDRRTQALRWAAVLAPLAMGAVMVVVLGNLRFALFALLSPVMAVSTWWSGRRAQRRRHRSTSAAWADATARFTTDLEAARQHRLARLERAHPDLVEIVRRAAEPSVRLWERRPGHADAFTVRLGSADREVTPTLRLPPGGQAAEVAPAVEDDPHRTELDRLVAAHRHLPAAPLPLDLATAPVVGLVGDRDVGLALARALMVQLAVLHGPADLPMAVLAAPDHRSDWQWTTWLPPTAADDGAHARLVGSGPADAAAVVRMVRNRTATAPTTGGPTAAVVVDDGAVLADDLLRDLLRDGTTIGIVLAHHTDRLPAACATVVDCRADGTAVRTTPATGEEQPFLPALLSPTLARRTALALAHVGDPEVVAARGRVPRSVRLADLLATAPGRSPGPVDWPGALEPGASIDPTAGATRLATPLGEGADGPVWVDLVADGPHALVGGTTGAGKSELLRSLVAGLAARHTTDQVVFVLVDYKGGAAFRACADLPHVVGLVTDLDDHLGARALTSLEAELRTRERILAQAGVADLDGYAQAGRPLGPLPRLVVVVDEFATLATELPGFVDALVGVAQRGRSLGMHLVLATQRPRGSVDANVRANTNLRIALRVQDAADSRDVVDDPVAAELPRTVPGRAVVRRGHADLEVVQAALATLPRADAVAPVAVAPVRFAPTSPVPAPTQRDDVGTDLEHVVTTALDHHARMDTEHPRRPWLPMLPDDLHLDGLHLDDLPADGHDDLVLGLVDRPELQDQVPLRWGPSTGPLAAVGPLGSGTTTTLCSVAAAAVATRSPDDFHLYAIDAGGGGLAAVAGLPHTGAVLGIDRPDEHDQLLRWLAGEVRRRQGVGADERDGMVRILLLVDNLPGLLAVHDDRLGRPFRDALTTVLEEGADMGVGMAMAIDRAAALPTRIRGALARPLVLGRPDDRDLAVLGLRLEALPAEVPGRGIDARSGHVVQVARLADPDRLDDVATSPHPDPDRRRRPRPVRGVPRAVACHDLPAPAGSRPVVLPVGMGSAGRALDLVLRPGDHAAIVGPSGSGRTTLLCLLSSQLRRAVPDGVQVGLCSAGRSALHGWPSLDAAGSADGLAAVLHRGMSRDGPWFVLVDDVRWAGADEVLAELVDARPDLHLVVAGRPDEVRGGFGAWQRRLRASRTGVLLQPDLAVDGDLLGATLPRHLHAPMRPGRGFVVVDGTAELAQFADVPADPPAGSIAA